MRGSLIIEVLLGILQAGAETGVALFDILCTDNVSSRKKINRALRYGDTYRFETDWAKRYRDWRAFKLVLAYLQRQGLVEEDTTRQWKLTKKGRSKLEVLHARNLYGSATSTYSAGGTDTSLKIILYDVPSREDKKRGWLRQSLRNLGFENLQKSAWVGKRKIPVQFLTDLRQRQMVQYVHIFEVSKSGTLKELTPS